MHKNWLKLIVFDIKSVTFPVSCTEKNEQVWFDVHHSARLSRALLFFFHSAALPLQRQRLSGLAES